ncbi:MAG: hypothetical protein A2Z18_09945 [Armatimonadetes bacterium RBG_16_58_9]|nr:MAG: hypothetical protein A2Z18_09945 [Armatimonadetes bacterium RBG_16_58_9]
MRNLRAELDNWSHDARTEWNPGPGDVLVGVVENYSSHQSGRDTAEAVTVHEEETGALVLVNLGAPELANLFRLQRPRVGERIGLKCAGKHPRGSDERFLLMVDRGQTDDESDPSGAQTNEPHEKSSSRNGEDGGEPDENSGAAAEQRFSIQQTLGLQPTSDKHFSMLVDRQPADDNSNTSGSRTYQLQEKPICRNGEVGGEPDEDSGATAEERLFIEQALGLLPRSAVPDTEVKITGSSEMESALREIVKRQDEEICRQMALIEKMENVLSMAIRVSGEASPSRMDSDTAGHTPNAGSHKPDPDNGARRQRRTRNRTRFFLTAAIIAAASGLGIAAHFLYHIP